MVAQQRHEPATVLQVDQQIKHASAIDPAINIVTERDYRVLRGRLDRPEQTAQGDRASVNITNGNFALREPARYRFKSQDLAAPSRFSYRSNLCPFVPKHP